MQKKQIHLIVGLGNPGRKYALNRHNVGFWVVEEVARRRGLRFGEARGNYQMASDLDAEQPLVLLKPMTYMNLSGEALAQWSIDSGNPVTGEPVATVPLTNVPLTGEPPLGELTDDPGDAPPTSDLDSADPAIRPLIVCDDLALPLGSVRIRGKGSSGGQNGLESIIETLEGDRFPRVRLGIAGGNGVIPADIWAEYVLTDFDVDEEDEVREMLTRAADMLECWLEKGLEQAASQFNRRIRLSSE